MGTCLAHLVRVDDLAGSLLFLAHTPGPEGERAVVRRRYQPTGRADEAGHLCAVRAQRSDACARHHLGGEAVTAAAAGDAARHR